MRVIKKYFPAIILMIGILLSFISVPFSILLVGLDTGSFILPIEEAILAILICNAIPAYFLIWSIALFIERNKNNNKNKSVK